MKSLTSARRQALLLTGILLVATNLRAPFTIVGPLLTELREDLQLSTTAAGALVTLPLLGFAAVSPVSALLGQRFGLERTLFVALLLIAAGILIRSAPALGCLYAGTTLIGMSIAVGNVLLPALIKRDFPDKIAAATGAYAVAMGATAALVSAIAVPLSQSWGWARTLESCLILPLAALAVWWPQMAARSLPAQKSATTAAGGVWRSPLAWQVTLFLGFNSVIYYIAVAWLPSILVSVGFSTARAGTLQGVMQLASALPGLAFGPVIGRMRDQRVAALVIASLSAVGYAGFLVAPAWSALWSALFGFGSGAAIILGLAFTGLRARDAHQAAALSGMAQCIGYLLASIGPTAMASLHDASGGWTVPLEICTALAVLTAIMGWLAGHDRHLE